MKKLLTFIAFLLAASLPSLAARVYSFTTVDDRAGLSSGCVKSILQDSRNFMWFGTKDGLNRYDGRNVKYFNCFDKVADRGNNNIGAMYEASDGSLWIGTDRGVYRFDPRTETFHFVSIKSAEGVSADNWVQDICGDKAGNVWVLVPEQGVFCFHDNKVDYHKVTPAVGKKGHTPLSIISATGGEIYVGTSHEGLFVYDTMARKFIPVNTGQSAFDDLRQHDITVIKELSAGRFVLATADGHLYRYTASERDMRPVSFSSAGKIYLRSIEIFDDEIWIGTQTGIFIVNMADKSERRLTDRSSDVNGLLDNLIQVIYRDKDQNVWLGTMFGGACHFVRNGFLIEKYLSDGQPGTLPGKCIRGMATADNGMIYIGTEDSGICTFDPSTGRIERVNSSMPSTTTSLIMRSYNGEIYSGISRGGVDIINPVSRTSNKIAQTLLQSNTSVYAVLTDRDGSLWIGADWGLFRRRRGSDVFERIPQFDNKWIFDLCQDHTGKIWVAAMGDGIWTLDPVTGKAHHYPYDEKHSNGLRTNSISAIMEDSKGRIWLSSDRGGLSMYDSASDRFRTYGTEEGLPSNVVFDVLEDARGYLWFGTNNGLVKFNPSTGFVKVFTIADGLAGIRFNYHSATKGHDGYFYFGGVNGLIAFNPDNDIKAMTVDPIYFTGLSISRQGKNSTSNESMDIPLMFTDRVEIPYDSQHITVSMASPEYGCNGSTAFSYRLTPVSEQWIQLGNERDISFATLAPGDYTLEVRAVRENGEMTRTLKIHVPRPWYSSVLAWCVYILAVLAVGLLVARWYKRRREVKQKEREYLFKVQSERELYENKIQFFSEIAHEIRTPLTLIQTPLEAITEIGVKDARINRYLDMMKKNTTRLMDLVTQLIDFQKLGNSRTKLHFELIDITALLNETIARFTDAFELRNKTLTAEIPDNHIQAMVDKEALTKMISNLLSNALKYSDKNTCVRLESDDKEFALKVTSDGRKITGEDIYKIFTPFYQAHPESNSGGVGIGLPLSKMLASLHNGSIELETDDTPENTFVIRMPLRQEGMETPLDNADSVKAEYVMDEEPQHSAPATGQSMLLVEDNEEMRSFLSEQLSHWFIVDTAADGREALNLLGSNNYDIIVTDIMMPRMDGYELCREVKGNVELSHIPIVFLTAKNDLESKVAALKCGGEAYIEKPFSIKYFRQQVMSLLDNRRNERRSLVKKPFFSVDNVKMSKADEEFMNKVVKTIQEHIDDETFNVEAMADVLCISRSSLLRKIKAVFNISPIELIRLVRLKKAAELIKEGKYRIGDICFMVGINSSSYFSKMFLKQFGMTPKAFEQQCQRQARSASGESRIDSESLNL